MDRLCVCVCVCVCVYACILRNMNQGLGYKKQESLQYKLHVHSSASSTVDTWGALMQVMVDIQLQTAESKHTRWQPHLGIHSNQ